MKMEIRYPGCDYRSGHPSGYGVCQCPLNSSGDYLYRWRPTQYRSRWWRRCRLRLLKSAWPSPDDYMKSFEGAENIVAFRKLHHWKPFQVKANSAEVAKKIYLKHNPNTNIHVITAYQLGVRKWSISWSLGLGFFDHGRCDHDLPNLRRSFLLLFWPRLIIWSYRASQQIDRTSLSASISVWSGKLVRRVPLSYSKSYQIKEAWSRLLFDERSVVVMLAATSPSPTATIWKFILLPSHWFAVCPCNDWSPSYFWTLVVFNAEEGSLLMGYEI